MRTLLFIIVVVMIGGCVLNDDEKVKNPLVGKWQDDAGNVFLDFFEDNTYRLSRDWLINGTPAYSGSYKVWGDSISMQWSVNSTQVITKIYKFSISGDASNEWLTFYVVSEENSENYTSTTSFRRFKH